MVRSFKIKSLRRRDAGVTLLEIMVVLAIIALITTLAAPRIIDRFGRAKSQAARIQAENIKAALQLYYIDVGRYPTEAENLNALLESPAISSNWAGPYAQERDLVDPWGRVFLYRRTGKNGEFDLLSYGRDGQPGGTREDADTNL